jgi:hypothetical protein
VIGETVSHYRILNKLGERAYKQRDGGLVLMKGDPLLRSLHSDTRWREFLQKMKLTI